MIQTRRIPGYPKDSEEWCRPNSEQIHLSGWARLVCMRLWALDARLQLTGVPARMYALAAAAVSPRGKQ